MRDLEYLDIDILGMKYSKDIEEGDDLDIEVSINYTLNFDEEEKMAFGECFLNIDDENHEGKLSIELHTVGIFSFMAAELTDDIRRVYHKESIRVLNPKWNELIYRLTELADIAPIELEEMEIEDGDISLGGGENLN